MHPKLEGAYTGEVSPVMLRSLFCTFVILGHSERREYFGETDAFINEKVLAALESSLKPILCVGETLEQREAGETMNVVKTQLVGRAQAVSADAADNLVIAYEPVWAIGTGKTATPEMAQEVHKFIRDELTNLFGAGGRGQDPYPVRGIDEAGKRLSPHGPGGHRRRADRGASLKAKSFAELVEIASSK
jgi:triosephosphate isomerase